MSHLAITGLGGGFQPRLEINNFVQNDRHFSLYVQALDQMQKDDQSRLASFFQVGGIHGAPYVMWDGARGDAGFTANPNDQWAGYCTHGSTLFPTWHRPYVMLIEQILGGYAQQIANKYTVDQAAWKRAASELRQPYWDWAANSVPPPQVISQEQVAITAPNGTRINFPNPLLRYNFHPVDSSFPSRYQQWKTTLRQPNSSGPNAKDDVNRLRSVLKNAQKGLTQATYTMFTRVTTWKAFSSHTVGDGGSASNSVEAIHDNIHVAVGGNGHMSSVPVAAFDPIFFLHHTNVDRLISMWSAVNYNVWMTNGDAQDGSFTLKFEQPVTSSTPLTPFWKNQNSFWLSDDLKDTRTLGYTYPEFQGLDMNNKEAVKNSILQAVDRLYGPRSPAMQLVRKDVATDVAAAVTDLDHGHEHANSRRHRELGRRVKYVDLFNREKYSDWTVRVSFNRHELGSSFSILFFLDEVPQDPHEWLVSPHLVGAHHAFVHSMGDMPDGGSGSLRQEDLLEEGFVPLNAWIADNSGLDSFDAKLVEPYLTKKLQWRVQMTDGTPVDLKSLEVMALEVPLEWKTGAIIPAAGKAKHHKGITHGKPGGYRDGLVIDI